MFFVSSEKWASRKKVIPLIPIYLNQQRDEGQLLQLRQQELLLGS